MSSQKTGNDKDRLTGIARIERFHPYKTFLFFGLVGSAVLFLSLILLYAIKLTSDNSITGFQLPNAFFVSTVVMLFSSYGLTRTMHAFKNDQIIELTLALTATFVCSIVFIILQATGWYQMFKAGLFINGRTGIAFLYIITGIHLLHVLIGIVYLLTCLNPVYGASKDMVKALVFFSDKYQETKIELLNIYWHYVDFLWLCLFFMFLFTM